MQNQYFLNLLAAASLMLLVSCKQMSLVAPSDGDSSSAANPVTAAIDTLSAPGCRFTSGEVIKGVMPGLIIGATVLTGRGPIDDHAVHVRFNGRIGAVGTLNTIQSEYPRAALLDCRGIAVLTPGFINAHEHPAYSYAFPNPNLNAGYEHRDEWRQGLNDKTPLPSPQPYYYQADHSDPSGAAKLVLMELRHLLSGTTTIGGIGGVPGLARNVGLESRVGDLEIYDFEADVSTFPYSYSSYIDQQEECLGGDPAVFAQRDDTHLVNVAYVPHVGEGRRDNCAARGEMRRYLQQIKDPKRRYSVVHAIASNERDFRLMVAQDMTLVWSPRSNLALYGETLDVLKATAADVRIALGTDWSPSGSYSMREEIACARKVLGSGVDEDKLWQMATVNGAYALGLEHHVGSIEAGQLADLVLIRGVAVDPVATALAVVPKNILAVMVGGEIVLAHASLAQSMPELECMSLPGMEQNLCADIASLGIDQHQLISQLAEVVPIIATTRQVNCELPR